MLNTLSPCLTAAAGTEFARDILLCISNAVFFQKNRGLRQFAFSYEKALLLFPTRRNA